MAEVAKEQAPQLSYVPTAKEKKYDRQLRLWAASGQAALEQAHVLLVNSGSGTVGVETLKNLVLPGIGKFTIADTATVDEADLGVNFFLDENSLGESRAQNCTKFLQELNPDVQGTWTQSPDIRNVLSHDSTFTFIIYSHPISPERIGVIERYCETRKIPRITVHSAGFYSYFSLSLPGNFPVVETHPEAASTTDLRLLSPWPELSTFALELTANLETLDDHAHGHVPYLILLLHYLEDWKAGHNGNVPTTYPEKKGFGRLVHAGQRTNSPEGGEENYEEAEAAILKNLNFPSLNSGIRDVFESAPGSIEAQSPFWTITSAVKKFYELHKVLPLPGAVPDMKAESEVYVRLQNLYKAKARRDVAEVLESVRATPSGHNIPIEEVEIYCKNAQSIRLIREPTTPVNLDDFANTQLADEYALVPTLAPIYLALKASEMSDGLSKDDLNAELIKLVPRAAFDRRLEETVEEVVRARQGELHNTSALTGGMVAQETIKIITKQYIPIDNTCVFDGISSRTQTFKV